MSTAEKILVLDGARTPVGSFGGVFKDVSGSELGAAASKEALARSGIKPDEVDEVVMGCIGQVGPDAYNARRVALAAGLPKSVPAYTVNRLCGSGLQAIWSAAMQMRWGGVDLALAGGNESMSRMPFYDFGARSGFKLGNRSLVDGTVMMLTDPFHEFHMGVTAEKVAEKYDVSRQAQDEFALRSQQRVRRRPGGLRRGDRSGRGGRLEAVHGLGRRAPHARDHDGGPGRAATRLPEGRHGHRGRPRR